MSDACAHPVHNMRILHLTPGCFDKGGISRYSRYQIRALGEICGAQNVRVLSLLGPDENSLEDPLAVHWHGSGAVTKAGRVAFAARSLIEAAAFRPQIIVSAHVNFGPLLSAAARIAGARTLLNVYGLELWSGLSPTRRSHMARVDTVIADCHSTADYVTAEALNARPLEVIWDCVDLDRFRPGAPDMAVAAKYGIPDPGAHFLVMSLGRLAKEAAHKGYDRLIEVIARLAPQVPNLRLVIAGRGDDRPRLEALAAARGISDRVVFTGSVDESDLPALYRLAHVFSLVSDKGHGRGEGIPLTPLEAMACGAAIIVGDEDGSHEAVDAGRNGAVVSPRDPDAHCAALRAFIHAPARLAAARGEARKVAEERFGYAGFVAKHRRLLAAGAAAGSAR